MRSSSSSKRTHQIVRNYVIPLFLLLCLGLAMFWLWSLFLLITDYGSTHSLVDAGTDLLSYTVETRAEYQSRVPWLRYKPDHRFDHLLQHADVLQHTSLDRVGEGENPGAPIEKIITEYPTYFSFRDLVTDWAIADTSVEGWKRSKAHPSRGQALARFDWTDMQQRRIALRFRQEELPFVLINVPEVEAAPSELFSLENLKDQFGHEPRQVERSTDKNHFMYYTLAHRKVDQLLTDWGWTAPQIDIPLTFDEFLRYCSEAEKQTTTTTTTATTSILSTSTTANTNNNKNNNNNNNASSTSSSHPLHYMTISAGEGRATPWIADTLPFFTSTPSFFIVDPAGYKGINCRFGMRGVTAAAHYDGQRNFVAMLRGRKRYMLMPPEECPNLELLPPGHPSARHSPFDWESESAQGFPSHPLLAATRSTEVVLSMGEMLYIPSYWFHYIVSQDASIQCNARSGHGTEGRDAIDECGFSNAAKDQQRVRNDEVKTSLSEETGRLRKVKQKDDNDNNSEKKEKKKDKKKKSKKSMRGKGRWAPEGEQWTFEN